MGFKIGCPYYISDKRKTITCEGRIKFFTETDRKTGHMKNICESNYANCVYHKALHKIYDECDGLSAEELECRLQGLYLAEERKTIKRLIQQMGIMEKNISHNIEVKQAEISKLRQELKLKTNRQMIALLQLAAVMHEHGIETVDFSKMEKFREEYIATFEDIDGEGRTAKLVVKERFPDGDKKREV